MRADAENPRRLALVAVAPLQDDPDVAARPRAKGMTLFERRSDIRQRDAGKTGKENDNEVKGLGNQQDYGARIYDPRLGRFLSLDPITAKYPELTPYQFASNRPIDGIDMDGLEYYNAQNSDIGIGLSYDPVLKKITSFSTYFLMSKVSDKLGDLITQNNKCENCIGSSAAQVASANLRLPNPFVVNQANAEADDICPRCFFCRECSEIYDAVAKNEIHAG